MSGGVDSSVAAHLLRAAGHDVVGVFMRHGEAAPTTCASTSHEQGLLPIVSLAAASTHGCCTAADAADARRVADALDIPFYALDFQEDFRQIIDYFVAEYSAARTPNPCVVCNNWIKFGRLFDYADSVGAQYVATGHYARLSAAHGSATPVLARGIDHGKDQSYVLFGIARERLSRMMLPVGEYRKPEIRRLARELGLNVADKRDSQEICFVTDGDHAGFVRSRRGAASTAGEIVTSDGRVVGTHDGLERFTVGQRKGLGIALGEPHFVVRLESETRRVVLGSKEDLLRRELTAKDTNWLVDVPDRPRNCTVKIRYNATPVEARVAALPGNRLHVVFDEPQHAVAPGQAVVCYDGEQVLGGGWIE